MGSSVRLNKCYEWTEGHFENILRCIKLFCVWNLTSEPKENIPLWTLLLVGLKLGIGQFFLDTEKVYLTYLLNVPKLGDTTMISRSRHQPTAYTLMHLFQFKKNQMYTLIYKIHEDSKPLLKNVQHIFSLYVHAILVNWDAGPDEAHLSLKLLCKNSNRLADIEHTFH